MSDIHAFGAKGNDKHDDSEAIAQCLGHGQYHRPEGQNPPEAGVKAKAISTPAW